MPCQSFLILWKRKCTSKMDIPLFWQKNLAPHTTPVLSMYYLLYYNVEQSHRVPKLNFTHFGDHCVRQSGLQDPTLHSFVFVYGVWFDCSICICLILCYWQNKSKFLSVGKCTEDSSRWILLTLGKAWILDKWKETVFKETNGQEWQRHRDRQV